MYKHEEQEFKGILRYLLRLAWVIGDPGVRGGEKEEEEDQEYKTIFSCILRLTWAS